MKVELDLSLTELRAQEKIAGAGAIDKGGMKLYDALKAARRKAEDEQRQKEHDLRAEQAKQSPHEIHGLRAKNTFGEGVNVELVLEPNGNMWWRKSRLPF